MPKEAGWYTGQHHQETLGDGGPRRRAALLRSGVRKDGWVRDLYARKVAGVATPVRRRRWRPLWKNKR